MTGAKNCGGMVFASGLLLCSIPLLAAEPAASPTPANLLAQLKPIAELRLRFEEVEQTPLADDAQALVLRARLGLETGKVANTSLLVEGEFLWPWLNDYRPDPTIPTLLTYPVVADAETQELNRLQLTNTSLPGTTLTIGRQRINLDDQRFVGSVGWRMNEQTFDAVRAVNKSVKNLTVDVSYFDQVNRVFGKDSPQGRYEGDSFLGNIAYQFKLGKLTAFSYLVDIEPIATVANAVRDSSSTFGLRFAGDKNLGRTKLNYLLSYAKQQDYADNPLNFDLAYYLLEGGVTLKQFTFGAGYEVLQGDGSKGFTTPLATLHRFQGWVDKFLSTPAQGIEDLYLSAGWSRKSVGPFETLSATVAWHDYRAENISQAYGSEINLQLQAKYREFTGLIKYGDYHADGLFTDTSKLWLQIEYLL